MTSHHPGCATAAAQVLVAMEATEVMFDECDSLTST